MRCFIVGGRERRRDQAQWDVAGTLTGELGLALRAVSVWGATAAALAVLTSPSVASSVMNAVMTAVHSFMTLFLAMVPHFQVGRFAYFLMMWMRAAKWWTCVRGASIFG